MSAFRSPKTHKYYVYYNNICSQLRFKAYQNEAMYALKIEVEHKLIGCAIIDTKIEDNFLRTFNKLTETELNNT